MGVLLFFFVLELVILTTTDNMSEVAKGCSHFLDYKQTKGLKSYHIIYKYLVKPSTEARKLKVGEK